MRSSRTCVARMPLFASGYSCPDPFDFSDFFRSFLSTASALGFGSAGRCDAPLIFAGAAVSTNFAGSRMIKPSFSHCRRNMLSYKSSSAIADEVAPGASCKVPPPRKSTRSKLDERLYSRQAITDSGMLAIAFGRHRARGRRGQCVRSEFIRLHSPSRLDELALCGRDEMRHLDVRVGFGGHERGAQRDVANVAAGNFKSLREEPQVNVGRERRRTWKGALPDRQAFHRPRHR